MLSNCLNLLVLVRKAKFRFVYWVVVLLLLLSDAPNIDCPSSMVLMDGLLESKEALDQVFFQH